MNLKNPIVLWFHKVNDTKWGMSSYKQIIDIDTVDKLISTNNLLTEQVFPNSMFFLMKKGIQPTWEDPINRKGGTWSFKINDIEIIDIWKKITLLYIQDKLLEDTCEITGVSIAPKKGYYILKVWTDRPANVIEFTEVLKVLGPQFNKNDSQYKSNH